MKKKSPAKRATKKEWPTEVDKNGKKKEETKDVSTSGNDEALPKSTLYKNTK